ncbi:hypothetical protein BC827DRAFT_201100 [Russula dissimulans]|nr:hypothetical protein BC827DRAFT_201100 [Russula dissimulans]
MIDFIYDSLRGSRPVLPSSSATSIRSSLPPLTKKRYKSRSRLSCASPSRSTRATRCRCSRWSRVRSGLNSLCVDVRPCARQACYTRVEKVPEGEIEGSRVLSGIMLNKDIVHGAPTDPPPYAQAAHRARRARSGRLRGRDGDLGRPARVRAG